MKPTGSSVTNFSSWNQKFLDYEIETIYFRDVTSTCSHRWNQKFLGYEIETGLWALR